MTETPEVKALKLRCQGLARALHDVLSHHEHVGGECPRCKAIYRQQIQARHSDFIESEFFTEEQIQQFIKCPPG